MRGAFARRPSPSLLISVLALIVAATGTASAIQGSASSSGGSTKGQSTQGRCDPSGIAFVNCVTVRMDLPDKGKVMLVAGGQWNGEGAVTSGQCRLRAGASPVGGEELSPGYSAGAHASPLEAGTLALTGVSQRQKAGTRTFRLQCRETGGNFQVGPVTLSAVLLG
jgi:hypothetical protein